MGYKSYEGKIFIVEDNETRLRRANDLSKPDVYKTGDTLPANKQIGDIKIIPKRTEVLVQDVRTNAERTVFVFVAPANGNAEIPAGWTKASNLLGGFLNEVTGLSPLDWVREPNGDNFTVTDSRAFLRTGAPDFASTGATIPAGAFVVVTARADRFVKISAAKLTQGQIETGEILGWTAASNLTDGWSGIFATTAWTNQSGANACWEKGKFIGAKILLNIVGSGSELKQITLESFAAYTKLQEAAAQKNLTLSLNSGFRTFQRQQELFTLFQSGNGNLAAAPGRSNHQNGKAFDLSTHGFDGDPTYDWLKKNGPKFGFIRTVNKEHWHWEYRPDEAKALAQQGAFKLASVRV